VSDKILIAILMLAMLTAGALGWSWGREYECGLRGCTKGKAQFVTGVGCTCAEKMP